MQTLCSHTICADNGVIYMPADAMDGWKVGIERVRFFPSPQYLEKRHGQIPKPVSRDFGRNPGSRHCRPHSSAQ